MKGISLKLRHVGLAALLGGGQAAADVFDAWSDPTRPHTGAAVVGPAPHGAGYVLQSTMVSPQRRVAVINGRRYSTGSRLANWEIVAIDANEVVLRDGHGEKRLQLLPMANIKRQRPIMEAKRHGAEP